MQTQDRSAEAVMAAGLPSFAQGSRLGGGLYQFVYLDLAGCFHGADPHLLADDEAARAHARGILAGATFVVVYRDGAKVSLLANLC